MSVPWCALCGKPERYDRIRTHFPADRDAPRYFFEHSKCAYHVEIDHKKAIKFGGALGGITDPDWSPWRDGAEAHRGLKTTPAPKAIVDYPGNPRERYCDLCKRRVLTQIWGMDNTSGKSLWFGVCPRCQDIPLNSDRYRRLKQFGVAEAPYHTYKSSPAAPAAPDPQTTLEQFVKVPRRRRRKK